jgi:glycosyltransferase involved in cell wall biosynthesis
MAGLDRAHGGPARTIPALCRAMQRHGVSISVVVSGSAPQSAPECSDVDVTFVDDSVFRRSAFRLNGGFGNMLRDFVRTTQNVIFYDVGIWLPTHHVVASVARSNKVPLVISPRGMLNPAAQAVARWKKRIVWRVYQRRDLRSATALHATSVAEAQNLRAIGLTNPIAVVPNGVEIEQAGSAARNSCDKRVALFIGRLHPIKGLANLVDAWSKVRPAGWHMIVAGPDEDRHRRDLQNAVNLAGLNTDFTFVGEVHDHKRSALLTEAELFILPSHSESFGLAVAEALGAGIPVITTHATPWQEIEASRCGWWIPIGTEALATALNAATKLPKAELQQMGRRGRKLVSRSYSWDRAAVELISVFEWLSGGGSQPTCVV